MPPAGPATIHVVGAGLAGLACAVRLVRRGRAVRVWEAAGHAGGRCRSFHDSTLDRLIDNGNHLLLSGNTSLAAYLKDADAPDGGLTGPARAAFPFLDLATGERWTVCPGAGAVPWWILDPARRVPGTRVRDYLAGLRLAVAGRRTVAEVLDPGTVLWRRFWEPLTIGVLNTAADQAAAALLWPVLRETFGRGEAACRPRLAGDGLGPALVEPAVRLLGERLRFHARLRSLTFDGGRVGGLAFGADAATVGPADAVVLAVPPSDLVPGLVVPRAFRAIVNAHFRLPQPVAAVGEVTVLGLVGGVGHWVFGRGDVASVTVSAADALASEPAEVIAARLWPDVARGLGLAPAGPVPPCRIIKEKRATIAQTPDETARRPGPVTQWPNLFLAGDWTDTGLPATVEGAARSGQRAADRVAAVIPRS